MNKNRLEAFSDGVIAIIITIMVLELKIPHGGAWADFMPALPTLATYVLSFVFVGIYWNNHHHMLHTLARVNGGILWANLYLLFWISLVPFITGWMGQSDFLPLPVAVYGFNLLMSAIAYMILEKLIIADQGIDSKLAKAVGRGFKEKLSLAAYTAAIPLAFVNVGASLALFVIVALMWIVPDRRIERIFKG